MSKCIVVRTAFIPLGIVISLEGSAVVCIDRLLCENSLFFGKLVIAGYFTSESNRKFNVKFADGVQIAFDDADNSIRQIFETEYNH